MQKCTIQNKNQVLARNTFITHFWELLDLKKLQPEVY